MPRLLPPNNLREGTNTTAINEIFEKKAGWFGFLEKRDTDNWASIVIWTHCRDVFQDVPDYALLQKGMWFCHGNSKAENVCEFIEKVESKLNLVEKTYFKKTKHNNIVWLQPSAFWIANYVRRSFFTMALRCGTQYRRMKDNFHEAMCKHYRITKETVPAIKRFLDGHTFYTKPDPTSNNQGWHALFTDFNSAPLQEKDLKKTLIKPSTLTK